MGLSREQVLLEYARCVKDTPYALKTYLQTYDNTQSQYVPLELFSDQKTLINDYDTYEENIALKYRQAGVSTVTAAWASKKVVTASKKKPEKVLIIANKLDTSQEFANKVEVLLTNGLHGLGYLILTKKILKDILNYQMVVKLKQLQPQKMHFVGIHQQYLFLTRLRLLMLMMTFGLHVWRHFLQVVKLS